MIYFKSSNSRCSILILRRVLYRPLGSFKVLYRLTDKKEYLAVCGATEIFRYIVEFIVKLGIYLYSKMLVVFISHKIYPKKSYFKYILRLFCGIMLLVYLN